MARVANTLRFLAGLLTPGGVLLAAAWALQSEEVMRDAVAPYAVYFCFGALAAAVLLSWYHDQSRLLCTALTVTLAVSELERWPAWHLPLNFILFASLRESGVMARDGLFKIGIVVAQAFAVREMGQQALLPEALRLPAIVQLAFGIAALTLLTMAFVRRTKVEQGLLWALAAMFLGLNDAPTPETRFLYAGTTAIVLVFAVLEQGYDFAYRDELTGLLGRRAFTSVMGQLGRRYAIAVCDIDHFKRLNDTYGHDAGDQVLRMVAAKLSQVGGGGKAFRHGGEEFLVVFRGRTARDAEPFVEAIRRAIADADFVLRAPDRPARKPRQLIRPDQKEHPTITVTVSIGLAERSKRHSTPELVLEAADAALYCAKEAGRNCVKLAESTPNRTSGAAPGRAIGELAGPPTHS